MFYNILKDCVWLSMCIYTFGQPVWHSFKLLCRENIPAELLEVINRPGVAGAVLQTPLWFIKSVTQSSFVKISLQRRHALMVGNGAFSHKINYVK